MKLSIKYLAFISAFILIFISACTDKKEAARLEIDAGLKEIYDSHPKMAQLHFEKAIELDETNAEPYLYLGRVFLNQGKVDAAMDYTKKALKLNLGYGEAYRTMAQIYTIKGEKEKACANYKKAKEHGIPNLDNYLKFCK